MSYISDSDYRKIFKWTLDMVNETVCVQDRALISETVLGVLLKTLAE